MLVLIAAQTLDGFIARRDQPGTGFTSQADNAFLRNALKDFDSLVMGRKTYDTLKKRIQNSVTNRYLRKIVTHQPQAYSEDARPDLVEFTDARPRELIAELKQRGRSKTALLGGSQIYSEYLAAGVVEELWLTLEPKLFGRGVPLLAQPLEVELAFLSATQLSDHTLLLKYRLPKP